MKCMKCQTEASKYLDNELSPEKRVEFEVHLQACAECRAELAALTSQSDYLRELKEVEPSARFRTRLWQRIGAEGRKAAGSLWEKIALRWVPVPVVLSVCIVIFSAFTVISPLVYGVSDTGMKQQAVRLAAQNFSAPAAKNVFGPVSFIEFCNNCHDMMCKCGSAGECSCGMHR